MKTVVCSFCGKNDLEVVRMITAPFGGVAICNECVDLCAVICKEADEKQATVNALADRLLEAVTLPDDPEWTQEQRAERRKEAVAFARKFISPSKVSA